MWVKFGLAGLTLFVASAVVAFGIISLGGGGAFAQAPGGDSPKVRYNELLAQKLGINVAQLEAAQKAARDQMIDDAVAAGRLTAEQAAKLKSAEPGELRGFAFGRVAKGVATAVKNVFGAAAEVIGITPEELRTELRAGKSLAEIADDNDVGRNELKQGIIKSIEAQIQQGVTNGRLTQEQATRLKDGLDDHIDQIIDHEGGFPGRGIGPKLRPNQN